VRPSNAAFSSPRPASVTARPCFTTIGRIANRAGSLHLGVKLTELAQTLGQLEQSLVGILSQTAGSTGKLWVDPVNFRFGVACRRHKRYAGASHDFKIPGSRARNKRGPGGPALRPTASSAPPSRRRTAQRSASRARRRAGSSATAPRTPWRPPPVKSWFEADPLISIKKLPIVTRVHVRERKSYRVAPKVARRWPKILTKNSY
jgi:hypothetical protein